MAGRQSRHPPCNAVQTITHALTPHVALQSHPPQPATNKNATSADAVAQWLQRVRREPNFQTMNAGAVVERRRGDDEFMNGLPAALLRLFQTTRKQLEDFFPSRYPFRFYKTVDIAVVVSRNRLLLVAGGRLCATVACRLLCLPGQLETRSALIHATAIVSRRHFFYEASATCVATLVGHAELVQSVAFDPTGRFLATGSFDKTAKVWDISSDGTGTNCVATLVGHTDVVTSVAFDPTGCFVATGSWDKTAKIWDISSDGTGTTCVATLEGHDRIVTSVTFHPSAPYFATGSWDKTAKLWKLTSKGNERYVECVSTLKHDTYVNSVAFDPTGRFLVTGCYDNTARLWDCHLLLPSERLKLLAMGQSVIEGLVTDNPHLDERRKMSRSLTEHILPPGPSQKWTDPPSFNKDKIEVNREVKTKHIKEAPVTMEEVNGGRMSRRKHKRISRKYKKRALRRSRK